MMIAYIQTLVIYIEKFRISFFLGLFVVCSIETTLAFASNTEKNKYIADNDSTKETRYGGWGVSYHFAPSNESYKWDGFPEDDIPVYLPMHAVTGTIYWTGTGKVKGGMPKWAYVSLGVGLSYGSGIKKNLRLYGYPASTYQSITHGELFLCFGGKILLKDVYFLSLEGRGGFTLGKSHFKIDIVRNGKNINYDFNKCISAGCYKVIFLGKVGYEIREGLILALRGGYRSRVCAGPEKYNDPYSTCTLNLDGWLVGLELLFLQE